jgi:hypothetical protein
MIVCCAANPSRGSPLRTGVSLTGQPGVVRTLSGFAALPGTWSISAFGSYGWRPNLLVEGDSAQGSWGRLALSYAPWSFLQVAASVDQTVSIYDWADEGSGSLVLGAAGDPRFSLRTGWELGRGISLAGQVELLFPTSASTLDFIGRSISPFFDVALTLAPERIPLGIHLQLGYHHIRSGEMLVAGTTLTSGQMALSGATSSLHHLVFALGVEYRIGLVSPYVEFVGDVPIDNRGPEHAWYVVGLGARLWLGPEDAVQLMLGLEIGEYFDTASALVLVSEEVDKVWRAPWLINVMVGLTVRLPIRVRAATPDESETISRTDGLEPGAVARGNGRISGRVLCGADPCGVGPTVELVGSGSSPILVDGHDGSFTTSMLPIGRYRVVARLTGEEDQSSEVTVTMDQTAEITLTFPEGVVVTTGIRGRVTDFHSAALRASIRIPDLDVELDTDDEGQFQVGAEPGTYQVIIWAQGYQTQSTRVVVTRQGMVVMNIELQHRR